MADVVSGKYVLLLDDWEVEIVAQALRAYKGCFGGIVEKYTERLGTEERPRMVEALNNDIKSEEESIVKAMDLAGKIEEVLYNGFCLQEGGGAV